MRIIEYQAASDAPSGFEFMAVILSVQPGKPGAPDVLKRHPVTPFRSSVSATDAREKAQAWWDEQIAAIQAKVAGKQARAEARKAKTQEAAPPVEHIEEAF